MNTIMRVAAAAIMTIALVGGSPVVGIAQCPCITNCPAGDGGVTGGPPGGHKTPDLDGNGVVNLVDLARFAGAWPPNPYLFCADYDCNGIINLVDLAVFAAHWLHAGPKPGYNQPAIDHYKTYETIGPLLNEPLVLSDQFGVITLAGDSLVLSKFATPVSKNNEQMCDTLAHQSWYRINSPQPLRMVTIQNQFQTADWMVRDARFLVLPALKFPRPGDQLPELNHYICYEAFGDSIHIPVRLVDQFGTASVAVIQPRLFCNPCRKQTVDGTVYPIVDPLAHLTVYQVDPPVPYQIQIFMKDQFVETSLVLYESRLLCVPAMKLEVLQPDMSEWNRIRALYE